LLFLQIRVDRWRTPSRRNQGKQREELSMALVFITGSTDGLGRAAAQSLLGAGHDVVLHARSAQRAAALTPLASHSREVVVGDLRSAADIKGIADQVNAIGCMDAIIYNAGVYTERSRGSTPEGHAGVLAVNTRAIHAHGTYRASPPAGVSQQRAAPRRRGLTRRSRLEEAALDPARVYAESKLHVVALAFALVKRWPDVMSNAVNPGWARTKMSGAGAPVDLDTGQRTQMRTQDKQGRRNVACGSHNQNVRRCEALPATQTSSDIELV
jgi:NAD(P)-dependent dehydrogenase (short-subunit alcohol dehydrogenase family)